jgi:hypothetical protein
MVPCSRLSRPCSVAVPSRHGTAGPDGRGAPHPTPGTGPGPAGGVGVPQSWRHRLSNGGIPTAQHYRAAIRPRPGPPTERPAARARCLGQRRYDRISRGDARRGAWRPTPTRDGCRPRSRRRGSWGSAAAEERTLGATVPGTPCDRPAATPGASLPRDDPRHGSPPSGAQRPLPE